MMCPNCSSSVSEDQEFCGKCGHRVRETVVALSERLAKAEAQLAAPRSNGKEQKYLELETAENVMSRVKTWTTLLLFFTGIPAAVALLALTVMFGKGAFDLHSIAANAKQSVGAVLTEAQSVASSTQKTVNDARTTSQQVSEQITATQRRVAELKRLVDSRVAEAQKLDARIKESEVTVAALNAKVNSQTQQVAHLSQQVQNVESQRNIAMMKALDPAAYGDRIVRAVDGQIIDAKTKGLGDVYVAFALLQKPNSKIPRLDLAKIEVALRPLRDQHYQFFNGGVGLFAVIPGGSLSTLGGAFYQDSCIEQIRAQRPCIFYFSETMKSQAAELKMRLSEVQKIPDDNVRYVPLSSLDDLHKESVKRSGLDLVVVLGQN